MDVLTELINGVACSRFLTLVKPDAANATEDRPEDRTVPIAISSEQPVLAKSPSGKHYMEILDHGPGSMRQDRTANGLPLLVNHDEQQHVGIVLGSAVGDDKVLRGLGTFGRSALATEKLQDVRDGILRGVSVQARMFKPKAEGTHENGLPVIRFMDWEPLEVSLVPFEADTNAGVMRSAIIPDTTQRAAAKTKKVAGEELTAGDFAYVGDPEETDTWKLPIKFDSDEETKKHIQLALDLFSDTEGIPADKKQEVYDKIVAAAKAHGIKTPAENGDKTKRTVEVLPMPEPIAAPTPEALEVQRRADIQAYADLAPGVVTTADIQHAILSKRSAEDFRVSVVSKLEEKTRLGQVATAGESVFNALSAKDQKAYSTQRAFRYAIFKKHGTKIVADDDFKLEQEVSDALIQTTRHATPGVLMPTVTKRANTYTAAGQPGVLSTVTSPDVIKYLYNRARVMQLGAKRLAGIQGLLRIPVMGSTSVSNWLAESIAATPSNPGFPTDVTFTPHRLSLQGLLTMELLAQASPDMEAILEADQEEQVMLSIDYAAIQGTGAANNQPLGILNTTGIASIVSSGATLTSGGKALCYQDVVNFEKALAVANADSANMGWMLTPEVKALMLTTPKIGTTFPSFLYPDQNGPRDPNGIEQGPLSYKCGITNQLPKNLNYDFVAGTAVANLHAAIFGDFSTVVVGDWGTMDVIIDPYTQAGQGQYIITRNGLFDVELRHPQRLAACLTCAVE